MASSKNKSDAPLLNLSTTDFERPVVVIDDVSYEMRAPEEMSRSMRRKLQDTVHRLDVAAPETTEAAEAIFDAIEEAVQICMVDLPDEVLAKLPIVYQERLILSFLDVLRGASQPEKEDEPDGDTSPSESASPTSTPSPVSSGSTEEASATG